MTGRLTPTGRKSRPNTYHRFLDEAGDTTFYGKGRVLILGNEGVSKAFILGMVKFKEPLDPVRARVIDLQNKIATDPYFAKVPNVQKKASTHGYFLHAKDDPPEVRMLMYDLIRATRCKFQAVVARKIESIYKSMHSEKDEIFYSDLLSHLLKDKITQDLVLNIAERGTSTSHINLQNGLTRAVERFKKNNFGEDATVGKFGFNVQRPTTEPLLNIADYFCWAIQRIFERGETRYYDAIKAQVSLVADIYDSSNYDGGRNFYSPTNPLTEANKL